jgi:hypothetical protein
MNAERNQWPTALAGSCEQFLGKELMVKLKTGWGWNRTVDGVQQPIDSEMTLCTGVLTVRVKSFFKGDDGRIRGFIGLVESSGHTLAGLKAVLFTQSDGTNFDFNKNVCMVWGVWFGDQDACGAAGTIPEFTSGTVYRGYATVYQNENDYLECQQRLQFLDPRKAA